MKLSEFLQLSSEDKLHKKRILEAKEELVTNIESATKVISSLSFESIMRIATENKEVDSLCHSSVLQKHWDNIWRYYGPNPRESAAVNYKPINEYLPMPTIHCFDLLKGIFIYQGYLKLVKKQVMTRELFLEAEKYLRHSAQYGCFFAINALCTNGLALLKETKDQSIIYSFSDQLLIYAEKAASLYWTAGYYLLANVYQELSIHADILFKSPKKLPSQLLYRQAIEALCISEQLETSSFTMMHNAYQGKTLGEATHGKFITWSQAKERLIKLSAGLLTQIDLEQAEHIATEKVVAIKTLYNLESPPESSFSAKFK